ncbi:expressed unknown protein [Ectocarpus siliculosus]|uniref:Uncharacterized protein n=1 Tax=Ectocarpus siliculosus TaxID=2880 RepID=D8LEN6_ECTSI|nr:expressed unknown protein [Ectocarpus siliculosus]|eukprot:CBN78599.1 expressed unknown protein [Ectocarpus siliculosus]
MAAGLPDPFAGFKINPTRQGDTGCFNLPVASSWGSSGGLGARVNLFLTMIRWIFSTALRDWTGRLVSHRPNGAYRWLPPTAWVVPTFRPLCTR